MNQEKMFAHCNICGEEFEVQDEGDVEVHHYGRHNDQPIDGKYTAFVKVEKRIVAPWSGNASDDFGVQS